jgi:hypothetical protein
MSGGTTGFVARECASAASTCMDGERRAAGRSSAVSGVWGPCAGRGSRAGAAASAGLPRTATNSPAINSPNAHQPPASPPDATGRTHREGSQGVHAQQAPARLHDPAAQLLRRLRAARRCILVRARSRQDDATRGALVFVLRGAGHARAAPDHAPRSGQAPAGAKVPRPQGLHDPERGR